MPKQPAVPQYRLHKARNCAVVTINGRNFYLGKYNSPESKEKYARLIAEHFTGGCPKSDLDDSQDISINRLIERYWSERVEKYYSRDGKPTDRQYHVKSALTPLRKVYGRTKAYQFGPKKLKAVREEMIQEGVRRRGGLNRNYVNDHVGIIKRMFRWAVSEEILPREVGPALCAQLETVENLHKNEDVRVHESKKVLPAPRDNVRKARRFMSRQIRTMIDLLLITGMRPDEVTIMRPRDLEKLDGIWIYRPHNHKMDYKDIEKVIPLGPRAQRLLEPWLQRDEDAYLFNPREVVQQRRKAARSGQVRKRRKQRKVETKNKTRQPRDHYDDESFCQAVERACKKAQVTKWTPCQLRHNAATRIKRQFDRETARQILGHGSISTTGIYIEEELREGIAAMKKVG